MSKINKMFSKAEQTKLYICRERIQDAVFRVSEISDILAKRGWKQHGTIAESVHALNQILTEIEIIEHEIYKLKYEEQKSNL